jgi:hypothetical protein
MARTAITTITIAAPALNDSAGTRATWWNGVRSTVQLGRSSSDPEELPDERDQD